MIRLTGFHFDDISGSIIGSIQKLEVAPGISVKVSSLRLQCFKRSPVCVSCGRKGTYFAVEKSSEKDQGYHLNLYCIENGKEILMTHDHIVPVAKGGKNFLGNVQTMCRECNHSKGDKVSPDLSNNLKNFIADLIASGLSDHEIANYVSNSNVLTRIGFIPSTNDFIAIIRDLMTQKEDALNASACEAQNS